MTGLKFEKRKLRFVFGLLNSYLVGVTPTGNTLGRHTRLLTFLKVSSSLDLLLPMHFLKKINKKTQKFEILGRKKCSKNGLSNFTLLILVATCQCPVWRKIYTLATFVPYNIVLIYWWCHFSQYPSTGQDVTNISWIPKCFPKWARQLIHMC